MVPTMHASLYTESLCKFLYATYTLAETTQYTRAHACRHILWYKG